MAERTLTPTILVIFGGSGDLTWRKLIPSLFNLWLDHRLPSQFAIIGVDKQDLGEEGLRLRLMDGVRRFSRRPLDDAKWKEFSGHISTFTADFNDPAAYPRLATRLDEIEAQWQAKADRVFYLATPPAFIVAIGSRLGEAGLARDRSRARLVIEKPIGNDLESFQRLQRALAEHFQESQLFRIDHYLGKETVQNILAFRFANPLFEPIWDRRYVDHVAITVAEEMGVGHRGGYYEHAGALRDMVQNHLLQLLCLVAMEPPVSFEANEVRNKKVDVLHAIRPIRREEVYTVAARGQYGPGWIRGEHVVGYRQEEGIAPDSDIETFAALKLFVDNWRWQDVPFYLRTGKRLPTHVSEISIRFRPVPHQSFPSGAILDGQPARLTICIQPGEGIIQKFKAKQPGPEIRLRPVDMRFSYQEAFKVASPEAYETLLWDIMINDATLFMRADQVEAAWRLLMPILEVWSSSPPSDFPNYVAGTWGPESAESLIAGDGRNWLMPTVLNSESSANQPNT